MRNSKGNNNFSTYNFANSRCHNLTVRVLMVSGTGLCWIFRAGNWRCVVWSYQGPLLVTWFNFHNVMDHQYTHCFYASAFRRRRHYVFGLSVRPSVRVLYRQLELTRLTRPDLHHVVGLFILKDVRQSLEYPCALRVPKTSPHGFLSSLVIQSLWICCLRMMGISVK